MTGLADILLELESLNVPPISPPGFEHLGCTITPGTLFQRRRLSEYRSEYSYGNGGYPPDARACQRVRILCRCDAVVDRKRSAPATSRGKSKSIFPVRPFPGPSTWSLLAQEYTKSLTGRRWDALAQDPATKVICSSARASLPCAALVPPGAIRMRRMSGW